MKMETRAPLKGVKTSSADPANSVDLFDLSRRNEWGGYYCVQPAILLREVNRYWSQYLSDRQAGRR